MLDNESVLKRGHINTVPQNLYIFFCSDYINGIQQEYLLMSVNDDKTAMRK
jgi:hypothetical protein